MDKLYEAINEAYEGYQTALDYVKGWKQEATHRKGVVMALINAARKSNPELGAISAKGLFDRTAEMYEAAHAPSKPFILSNFPKIFNIYLKFFQKYLVD